MPASSGSTPRGEHPVRSRIVVLASGTGTLLQALIDATTDPSYPAGVVAVGSDKPASGALERARAAGIATFAVPVAGHADRAAWDVALTEAVVEHRPDIVVSAGFMRILGPAFLAGVDCTMINTHPALLPAFPGAHPVRDALARGVKVSGATVHLVDSGVDTGPILAQEAVVVLPGDTEADLHERIKITERRLLVGTVDALVRDGRDRTRGDLP